MPKKGKKRREAQRLRKQEKAAAEREALSPEEEAARLARARARAEHEAERLRRKRRATAGGGYGVLPWAIGGGVGLIGVIVIVFLLLGGGNGDGSAEPAPTPDPRIGTATPAVSLQVEAGGDSDNAFFRPDRITVKVREVFEIRVKNTGTVTHNLTISGDDKEYDTDDDWESVPYDIKAGEEGVVRGRIDIPGEYPFQCSFHPTVQFGTLVAE
jgi:plastocyanin